MIKLRTNPTYNRFILKVAQLKKNINLKNNLILHIIRYSKINIIRFIQNSWTFPISINILVKSVLGFSALERIFIDSLRSTLIIQPLIHIFHEFDSIIVFSINHKKGSKGMRKNLSNLPLQSIYMGCNNSLTQQSQRVLKPINTRALRMNPNAQLEQ